MNRRSTFKLLLAGGITTAGGGYLWLSKKRDHPALALDLALENLAKLNPDAIETTGSWKIARTFNHLAQSVEFSMAGFPEMKSQLFQNTAGRLAFSVFQAQGRMTHGLDEKIPGEIVESDNSNPMQARNRLISSLEKFSAHSDILKPHFAYGELSKEQYAIAHVMHINNHLEEFKIT